MTQAKQADAGRPAVASASTLGAMAGEPEQFRQRAEAPAKPSTQLRAARLKPRSKSAY